MSAKYGVLCFALGPIYEDCAYLLHQSCERLGIPLTIVVSASSNRLDFLNPIRLPKEFKNPFEAECLAYEISPYELTLKVDADCLLLSAPYLADLPIYSGFPRTMSYQKTEDSPYRKVEATYGLPDIYSTALVFSKSDEASRFFSLCKELFYTWYSLNIVSHNKLPPTTDSVFSLAWRLLDLANPKVFDFIHAKIGVSLDHELNSSFILEHSGDLFVQGVKQTGLFHYQDKNFLNHVVLGSLGYVRLP